MIIQTPDTNENTSSATDADEYERSLGHQMYLLSETLKQLEGDDRLGEEAAELREALGALDDAYMAIIDASNQGDGTSDEDADVQELVAEELAGITRRLNMLLALAAVHDAARTAGYAVRDAARTFACRPDAVEHCEVADDAE